MKRFAVICLFAALPFFQARAQLSVGDFMEETVVGKPIEKAVYTTGAETPLCQKWVGVYTSKHSSGSVSPVAGNPVTWAGYGEKGNSISIGSSFPSGVVGQRPVTYAFRRKVATGQVYLSFVICPELVVNRKYWMHVGFSRFIRGNGTNCCVAFFPEGRDGSQYNIALRLNNTLMVLEKSFSVGKKHLIVLKFDTVTSVLSVFVDPDLGKPESVPDEIATCNPDPKESGVAGIVFRDVNGNRGSVGGFRVSRVWEDIK